MTLSCATMVLGGKIIVGVLIDGIGAGALKRYREMALEVELQCVQRVSRPSSVK